MGRIDAIAQVGEDVGQVAAGVHVVVHHEDRGTVRFHGPGCSSSRTAASRTVKVLPRPSSLATRRLPLFFSRMARAMAKSQAQAAGLGRVERLHDPGEVLREECRRRCRRPSTSTPSPTWRPVIVSSPPWGMASRALRIRLPKTIRS